MFGGFLGGNFQMSLISLLNWWKRPRGECFACNYWPKNKLVKKQYFIINYLLILPQNTCHYPIMDKMVILRLELKEFITLEEMWGYATILFATTCDYVSFVTTFATTYQLHQIWGGFATILQLMCNYYFLHPPMWIFIGLY
jgi:hypothetical protein